MGISLNHVSEGAVGWFSSVDANWSTIQDKFVARNTVDTSVVSVTGTTSETVLMNTATIPANALGVGTVLRNWAAGTIDVPVSTSATFTFRLRWGGVAGTLLATVGAFTVTTDAVTPAASGWMADLRLIGVTTGVSGTAEIQRQFHVSALTGRGIVTATFDTTAATNLTWTIQSTVTTTTVKQRVMITELG